MDQAMLPIVNKEQGPGETAMNGKRHSYQKAQSGNEKKRSPTQLLGHRVLSLRERDHNNNNDLLGSTWMGDTHEETDVLPDSKQRRDKAMAEMISYRRRDVDEDYPLWTKGYLTQRRVNWD